MEGNLLNKFAARANAAQTECNKVLGIRSREEIEELKREWIKDPLWDIEDTEGFEAHVDELKAFHEHQKLIWDVASLRHTINECNRLGCSPNMLSLVGQLQYSNDKLQESLNDLYADD